MSGSAVFPGDQDGKDCNAVRRMIKIKQFSVGEYIGHKNPISLPSGAGHAERVFSTLIGRSIAAGG